MCINICILFCKFYDCIWKRYMYWANFRFISDKSRKYCSLRQINWLVAHIIVCRRCKQLKSLILTLSLLDFIPCKSTSFYKRFFKTLYLLTVLQIDINKMQAMMYFILHWNYKWIDYLFTHFLFVTRIKTSTVMI